MNALGEAEPPHHFKIVLDIPFHRTKQHQREVAACGLVAGRGENLPHENRKMCRLRLMPDKKGRAARVKQNFASDNM